MGLAHRRAVGAGNDTQYGNVPFILKNGKFEAEGKVI